VPGSVRTGGDSATTGMYGPRMPTPFKAVSGGVNPSSDALTGVRARVQEIARPVVRWATLIGLPLLFVIDIAAVVGLMPFLPPQVHSVLAVVLLYALVDYRSEKRAQDAVTSYKLGVMAGKIDQQREWEVVHRGVRPIPHVLHQSINRPRGAAQERAVADSTVVPFARRYDPA
jgi:hypothetical protein